jgi:hypothetical protein
MVPRGEKDDSFSLYIVIILYLKEIIMGCKECEKFQESEFTSYYRWKNANIEMRGCNEHLRQVFGALNQHQRGKKDAGELVVEVYGGCVESVMRNGEPVEYRLVDHDIERTGG